LEVVNQVAHRGGALFGMVMWVTRLLLGLYCTCSKQDGVHTYNTA
jgi:hypothetical protein